MSRRTAEQPTHLILSAAPGAGRPKHRKAGRWGRLRRSLKLIQPRRCRATCPVRSQGPAVPDVLTDGTGRRAPEPLTTRMIDRSGSGRWTAPAIGRPQPMVGKTGSLYLLAALSLPALVVELPSALRRLIRSLRARMLSMGVQWTLTARAKAEAGMSTAEYAVGTIAACGFAALLFKVVTSAEVRSMLAALIQKALKLAA
jgi:Protein of unknown function (DUF4244)